MYIYLALSFCLVLYFLRQEFLYLQYSFLRVGFFLFFFFFFTLQVDQGSLYLYLFSTKTLANHNVTPCTSFIIFALSCATVS